jgi:hypothetical protein
MLLFILKITFPILTLIIAFIKLELQNKWKDKRRKKYKLIKRSLQLSMVLTAILSIVLMLTSESKFNLILKNQSILITQMEKSKIAAEEREALAVNQRENLEILFLKFEKQIIPFIEIGTKHYPNKSTEQALAKTLDDLKNTTHKIVPVEERLNSIKINSLRIEGRLTCNLIKDSELPPSEVEFLPISDANSYLEGLAGRVRINFQSPVIFKNIGNNKITIINNFIMNQNEILVGRPIEYLKNFDNLLLPFITIVYGKSFDKMILLEVTIEINGKQTWYSSWPYDAKFNLGPVFSIPLLEFHKKILNKE